ncbi:MAG: glycerol-3-phosphate dehydrogenase/oxidase [Pseudobdellovibrionaceae bacterium]
MKNTFSFKDRKENIHLLKSEEFDLVIIGGGITGAGMARDAASRGMKVALIEQNDFAFGTSSRSSKLIHGGIRYLENLEFHLVFEALSERTKLFEIAPHMVHPLRFLLPIYRDSRVGMTKLGLGMWLYDALALFQAPEMHERLNAKETLERLPVLQGKDLSGSYVYSDAYMDDDRLVFETLRSATRWGAVCANYVAAKNAFFNEDGKIYKIKASDSFSGGDLEIRGKYFVSSVGPWTDELGSKLFEDWKKILRPTKGVHLTFARERLPLSSAVVMAEGQRIVFGIPRHEMVIVGTTDTDFKGDVSKVKATEEDVRYLLSVANEYFPGAKLTAKDIIATYAGVRPLVHDGSSSEGKTSREHTILHDQRGVTFVAGGKYTTYRLMAQQAVEQILLKSSIEDRVRFAKTKTEQPLNPMATVGNLQKAQLLSEKWAISSSLKADEVRLLADRHGMEAEGLLNYALQNDLAYWEIEAHQAIEHTMCFNLLDFYTRRTPLFLATPDHGWGVVRRIADFFQIKLHWSDSEKAKQIQIVKSFIDSELDWKKAFGAAPNL